MLNKDSITVPEDTTYPMAYRQAMFSMSLGGLQDITVYFGEPLYIMSPRIKIYRANQIMNLKGYLHKFEPLPIQITVDKEGNELEMDDPEFAVKIVISDK